MTALLPPPEAAEADLTGTRMVLLSLANDVTCVGIRTLAAVLEAQGAQVRVALLPASGAKGASERAWHRDVVRLCQGSDLVGLSVMSVDIARARALSTSLQEALTVPLVWGGPYPTLRPAECAAYADYVCVGDGEIYLAELLAARCQGRPPELPAPGIASRPCLPEHVDTAPRIPLRHTWLLRHGRVHPATPAGLREKLVVNPPSRDTGTIAWETVASRGCPHSCTFCGSTGLDQVQPEKLYRRRSVASVLAELREVFAALPFLTGVGFADDNFLARPLREVRSFAQGYARDIGVPLIAIGSPATITRGRLDALVDAGLVRIKMGIQSGSDSTTAVLGRSRLNGHLQRSLEAIGANSHRMLPPRFDILVDLPFEELEDRLDTLRMIADLPRPYRLELNSLRLMEGTPLHETARSSDWSTPDVSVNFKRIAPHYTNLVLALCREGRLPGWVVRLLAHEPLARPLATGAADRSLRLAWTAAREARRRVRSARLQ